MTKLKILALVMFAVALALPIAVPRAAESQGATEAPTDFEVLA